MQSVRAGRRGSMTLMNLQFITIKFWKCETDYMKTDRKKINTSDWRQEVGEKEEKQDFFSFCFNLRLDLIRYSTCCESRLFLYSLDFEKYISWFASPYFFLLSMQA